MREEEMIIALAGIGAGVVVCWVLVHYACLTFNAWQNIGLKREMIARGYTVQEIVDVVAARRGSRHRKVSDVPPAKPIKHPAYAANN
jgi:hypothetical protein